MRSFDGLERFYKYHALGNDFLLVDKRPGGVEIGPALARAWCDRRRGVGADGVLVLLPSKTAWTRMVVLNADGTRAEMCGNGIRCVAKFLHDRAPEPPEVVPIETDRGVLDCRVSARFDGVTVVEVAMGAATLLSGPLPSGQSGTPFVEAELPNHPGIFGTAVSLGNPHLVLFDRPLTEVETLGPLLEKHPAFPGRTNVEVVQVEGHRLRVAVWERGCGATQACGTGACAALAAARATGRLSSDGWVEVHLPGGLLEVRASPDLARVDLRGPAIFVFEGIVQGSSDR